MCVDDNHMWLEDMTDDDVEEEFQVEYFIDVVEQGNRFGIYKENSFKALSNFKIDISSEVKGAGPLSGYTCTVTLFDGTDLG